MNSRISIFGDSHAMYFSITPQVVKCQPELALFDVETHVLHGATITGMGRRVSTLRTQDIISKSLLMRPDFAIFSFGQVDLELGYFFRQIVKEEALKFERHASDIVKIYIKSIQELVPSGVQVIIKGINPPALIYDRAKAVHYTARVINENIDDPSVSQYLHLNLSETFPSDTERTKRHKLFNRILRTDAVEAGFMYFDLDSVLIEPASGLLDCRYVPAFEDHHLCDSLWLRQNYWKAAMSLINSRTQSNLDNLKKRAYWPTLQWVRPFIRPFRR